MVLQHKSLTNEQSECLIAFGSNLLNDFGATVELVEDALRALSRNGLFEVVVSGFYQTPAFPVGSGPDFVNGALRAQAALDAAGVLAVLHEVEAEFGRTRDTRWEARVLDLDLIDYGGQVLPDQDIHEKWRSLPLEGQIKQTPAQLILPHPRIQDRPFVLVPLRDVAPDWVHPIIGVSVNEMLAQFSAAELAEIKPLVRPV